MIKALVIKALLLLAATTGCSGPSRQAPHTAAALAPNATPASPQKKSEAKNPAGRQTVEFTLAAPSSLSFAVLDADGDLFIAPSLRAPATFGGQTFDTGFYAIKLSRDGTVRWKQRLSANTEGHASAVAVDGSGNLYLAGSFARELRAGTIVVKSAGDRDAFLLSLETDGTPRWVQTLGGAARETALALSLSEDANRIAIGGWVESTFTFLGTRRSGRGSAKDGFAAVYDLDGAPQWCQRIGGRGVEQVTALRFDGDELIVGGHFADKLDLGPQTLESRGNSDIFLARYQSDGNASWHRHWGGTGRDYVRAMRVLEDGSIALAGNSDADIVLSDSPLPAAGEWDILVWKVAPDGSDLRAHRIGGPGPEWVTHMSQSGALQVIGVGRGITNLGFDDLAKEDADRAFAVTLDEEFRVARGRRHSWARMFPTETGKVVVGQSALGTTVRY